MGADDSITAVDPTVVDAIRSGSRSWSSASVPAVSPGQPVAFEGEFFGCHPATPIRHARDPTLVDTANPRTAPISDSGSPLCEYTVVGSP